MPSRLPAKRSRPSGWGTGCRSAESGAPLASAPYERLPLWQSAMELAERIFTLAAEEGVPPVVAADRIAERRMAEVSRLKQIQLGG